LSNNSGKVWGILGLGNPGAKYANTRHNIGFWSVDSLKSQLSPGSNFSTKFNCEYLKINLDSGDVLLLVKPQGYMNLSGETCQPLLNFFKVLPENVIALHDEVDLPTGALKAKIGGSSGGHHGIDSLEAQLNTRNFYRVRIGIDRAMEGVRDVSSWVLSAPKGKEAELLNEAAQIAGQFALGIINLGLERAAQRFSRKPPAPS
jgi:PTH1 family peptidyl-tRNA hydrolase